MLTYKQDTIIENPEINNEAILFTTPLTQSNFPGCLTKVHFFGPGPNPPLTLVSSSLTS